MKKLVNFLENHVDGKTLYTKELIYELEGGMLQRVYSDQISFANLKYAQNSLQLDMFIVSNEKIYLLNTEEPLKTLRKDYSGVSLFRYELAHRKSTGEITGIFRMISASGKGVPAEAVVSGIYDIRINGQVLSLKEDQMLYRDQPVQDNRFKAVAFQADHRFTVRENKLYYEYNGRNFDINHASLERNASADTFPPFISAER